MGFMGNVGNFVFSVGAVITVFAVHAWTKSWDAGEAAAAFVAFLWGGFVLVINAMDKITQELSRMREEIQRLQQRDR